MNEAFATALAAHDARNAAQAELEDLNAKIERARSKMAELLGGLNRPPYSQKSTA